MCTFKITNNPNTIPLDKLLKYGGPDTSNTVDISGVYVTHHLLSITGEYTVQPIHNQGRYYLLMGEIYNYDHDLPSDIYYGIEQYEKHGDGFVQYLDGEYLFVVVTPEMNTIDIFTDPWSTRQCYFYKLEDHWYISTFPALEPSESRWRPNFTDSAWTSKFFRIPHNSHYRYNYLTDCLECVNGETHKWNLTQTISDLDDVELKFIQSVKKRYTKDSVLFLSGGYDSSCVAACLNDLGLAFRSITMDMTSAEDETTLSSILDYTENTNKHVFINDKKDWVSELSSRRYDYPSIASQHQIREETRLVFNNRVIITGNGGDELFENYIFKGKSEFTEWPEDLKDVFPWRHFYGGQSRRLLDYHETMSLLYGMEMRNVFYDKQLVQSWINTNCDIKNSHTKAFQTLFLEKRGIQIPKKIAGFGSQHYNQYG